MPNHTSSKVVVIGASAGGLNALISLFSLVSGDFPHPILIVQHTSPYQDSLLPEILGKRAKLKVSEAEDKMEILPGNIYTAPPNYHLLSETPSTLALSSDDKVNYSRPSIDVLFESVALVYGKNATGIILSGANNDGAEGMIRIKEAGGITIAQDPQTAEFPMMPQAAIDTGAIDHILSIEEIAQFLELKNNSDSALRIEVR